MRWTAPQVMDWLRQAGPPLVDHGSDLWDHITSALIPVLQLTPNARSAAASVVPTIWNIGVAGEEQGWLCRSGTPLLAHFVVTQGDSEDLLDLCLRVAPDAQPDVECMSTSGARRVDVLHSVREAHAWLQLASMVCVLFASHMHGCSWHPGRMHV
jgi:hypothetical protein